jgi:hypothetical protein
MRRAEGWLRRAELIVFVVVAVLVALAYVLSILRD